MIEIMIILAFIGALISGLWDLKTTEIPDEIPTLLAVFGIFFWYVFALTFGDFSKLILSILFGTVFLVFGWTLYRFGQWGGGDAKLLSAIGFMIPSINFEFDFFFNLFFVGLIYIIIYALAIGFMNKRVFSFFYNDLKKNKLSIMIIPAFIVITGLGIYSQFYFPLVLPFVFISFAAIFLLMFLKYCKIIEKRIFNKKIPSSKLRIGDVLLQSKKWDGLTEEELAEIKRKNKFVTIKEGVRFGMVFPINLIVTLFLGNLMFLFMGI